MTNTCFFILPLYSVASKPWKSDPSAPRPLVGRSDPEAGSKPSSRVPQHLRKWEDKGWWSETSWLYNNSIQWYWLWKMTCLHFTGWSCGCSHQLIVPILESLSMSLNQGFPGTFFLGNPWDVIIQGHDLNTCAIQYIIMIPIMYNV